MGNRIDEKILNIVLFLFSSIIIAGVFYYCPIWFSIMTIGMIAIAIKLVHIVCTSIDDSWCTFLMGDDSTE